MTNDKLREMAEDIVEQLRDKDSGYTAVPEIIDAIFEALSTYGQSEFQRGQVEGARRVAERVATMTNTCPIEGHPHAPCMCPHWIMAQMEANVCAQAELEMIKSSSKPE
jgi:hypothetical protein